MTDAYDIKEHMDVIGADGVHVGTVDTVEGAPDGTGRIKLTRDSSSAGLDGETHAGHHHFIPIGLVAEVEGDTVRLSANADVAVSFEEEEGEEDDADDAEALDDEYGEEAGGGLDVAEPDMQALDDLTEDMEHGQLDDARTGAGDDTPIDAIDRLDQDTDDLAVLGERTDGAEDDSDDNEDSITRPGNPTLRA